jgi:signal transduction histidine kinase
MTPAAAFEMKQQPGAPAGYCKWSLTTMLYEGGEPLAFSGQTGTSLTGPHFPLPDEVPSPSKKRARSGGRDDLQLRRSSDMFIVGQMASGIAHDFNNRLQGVVNAFGLMKTRLDQGRVDECRVLIDAAQDSLLRAEHLARRLLNFARIDEALPRTVDVNDAIAAIGAIMKCLAGPRIDVSVELGVEPMLACLDLHQFENALFNLVVNARDAMPDGGRISIETSHAELAVDTRRLKRGRYAHISISDTGCGMPERIVRRVFDPFFTTKPVGKGTGLGLPMVKAFVDKSDGHIEVRSTEGVGTTISIYLPCRNG